MNRSHLSLNAINRVGHWRIFSRYGTESVQRWKRVSAKPGKQRSCEQHERKIAQIFATSKIASVPSIWADKDHLFCIGVTDKSRKYNLNFVPLPYPIMCQYINQIYLVNCPCPFLLLPIIYHFLSQPNTLPIWV